MENSAQASIKSPGECFAASFARPSTFFALPADEQATIDAQLGISHWKGGCGHRQYELCIACNKAYRAHYADARFEIPIPGGWVEGVELMQAQGIKEYDWISTAHYEGTDLEYHTWLFFAPYDATRRKTLK